MLMEEEYIGNSQRTQISRYYSIKFKKQKWDPSFFNRRTPSTDILSFMQFVMFLCGINTRPGLTSKKGMRYIEGQAKKLIGHFKLISPHMKKIPCNLKRA